jgi:purine-nucleoside phosphorylase
MPDRSLALARALEARGAGGARIAIVAGSGIGGFAELLDVPVSIPFAELEEMPRASVPGHAGRFVVGDLVGVRVLVQEGRVHLYEGRTAEEVARSVRAFRRIGCAALVLSNASGGLRNDRAPPFLMRIEDHLNLQGASPLAAGEAGSGSPYDAELGEILDACARETGIRLERGVYAGLQGPSYETPAEIRMLAWAGADAVGMSTVCEAQAARAAGLRVAGIACVTNAAAGISRGPLAHGDVLSASASLSPPLANLLARALPRIAALQAA